MHIFHDFDLQTCPVSATNHAVPGRGPANEPDDDQEGLELPVNPDQGTPLIPDEEGVVTVPA